MDQDTLVSVNLAGGWEVIGTMEGRGLHVHVAFWARRSEDEKWRLYLAFPAVDPMADNDSLRDTYSLIYQEIRNRPEWGVNPFAVVVLGVDHPMAKAAAELVKPKPATDPKPKSYSGMTRFGGLTFGGMQVEGVLIYPPWREGINPAA